MRQHHVGAVSGAALLLALVPAAAQAADLVQTLEDQGQFSKLVGAIEQAGLTQSLQGEGPFTVFAPTDEAFGKLPEGAVDQLANGDGQLGDVLKHHVVEGKELMAKDVLGQETKVSTLSGDQITVDGTATMMVLVPAGLQIARVGDQIFVQREVGAMAAPAVTVTASDQQSSGSTSGQQQAASGSGSSSDQSQQATQNPEAAAGQELTEEQRSAAAQQQAGSGTSQGQPMEQQQGVLRAAMVVQPDIQADNGVIHAIDEVLVPQKIEQQLSQASGQPNQQASQQGQQSGSSN